jgi:hypothetical protein
MAYNLRGADFLVARAGEVENTALRKARELRSPIGPTCNHTPPADPTPPAPADPVEHDYDHDGLSKHDELFTHHTNPFLADTDFDGVLDKAELTNGTNPLNPLSH